MPENLETKFEGEKPVETKVILEFMRHSIREKDPSKANKNLRLTPEGRELADEKGEKLEAQPEVSLAWGTSRERTQETSFRAMLPDYIEKDQTLEEIEGMVAQEQKYGKKMIVDDRLNFDLSGPAGIPANEDFNNGKYLGSPYLFEQSDLKAIETGDKISTTYLRQAGNVAEIVDRYIKVGNNFNRLASKINKYEEFGNQLERYLGSHQGVVECFVAKVLENKFGVEKRREFQKGLGNGFKETEGIRLEIINRGAEQKITMTFRMGEKDETAELDRNLVNEIIQERQKFEEKINQRE
jgi:hypothetical protein